MNNKVLITYATKLGSTIRVAETIGKVLTEQGFIVDILSMRKVMDLESYQAAVIGSAIRHGRWLPEALKFVKTHQHQLKQIPIAYFTVCMTLHQDTPENRKMVREYLNPVCEILTPNDIGLFAGTIIYQQVPLIFRPLLRLKHFPEGDFRQWETIQAWAEHLPISLILSHKISA